MSARQVATVVAWQATVAVLIGVVVGIALGILIGRALWDLFAGSLNVVPSPSVPALSIIAVGIGAIVLGNLVAAVPGRIARRTSTALLFRVD